MHIKTIQDNHIDYVWVVLLQKKPTFQSLHTKPHIIRMREAWSVYPCNITMENQCIKNSLFIPSKASQNLRLLLSKPMNQQFFPSI
jgi:hypothetical protein